MVISVGNLTLGGAGKTPASIYVAKLLKNNNVKTGIISRGYGRNSKGYKLVFDGDKFHTPVDQAGDEIYFAADELRIPAAVAERRVEGATKLLSRIPLDVLVLDDAYQHRWIHRDVNILIIDQRFLKLSGNIDRQMFPLGLMREPFSSVKRADAVIINRKFSERIEMPDEMKPYFDRENVFYANYGTAGIHDVKTHESFRMEEFTGQKSLVVCGIARPFSFFNVLKNHGIDITNTLNFRDHKTYTNKEVQQIRKQFYETNSYSVLTTQKDAVKFTQFAKELDDIDIYYLKIELEIERKSDFKNFLIGKIKQ